MSQWLDKLVDELMMVIEAQDPPPGIETEGESGPQEPVT